LLLATVAAVALQASMVASARAAMYDTDAYLFFPSAWVAALDLREPASAAAPVAPELPAVGGLNVEPLPLDIKYYQVRSGDTLSSIAFAFGLELDTVASLNRQSGVGVHMLDVGELLSIPNQDGILLPAGPDLERTSVQHGLMAEIVLQVNLLEANQVTAATHLFFPGVQHSGSALTLAIGAAFVRPVIGAWVSSSFGRRSDPFTGEPRLHHGVDLAARRGSAVLASQDGRVAAVGDGGQLGKYVIISHFVERYSSVYGHLDRILVRPGESVSRGAVIGNVGSTGRSTAPHLHFELRQGRRPVDPADLIARMR
jgi:murein DD-endopeptidase MepM/ murein hydrolase activator NlpD